MNILSTLQARLDRTSVVLGQGIRGPVSLPWKVRQSHIFALGLTGVGKSRLMSFYAKELRRKKEGFLVLDPHGAHDDSFFRSVAGMATHVIDLNASHVRGFNPLYRPEDTHSSVIVGNVMDALAVAWEGESFTARPTIERNLRTGLTALVEMGLTLCELLPFYDPADQWGLRRRALAEISDPYVQYELHRLHDLSKDGRRRRDYDQEVLGPANRLARIIAPPAIRAMVGQTKDCLDIKAAMDGGETIAVNLSGGPKAYERDADLFGRLLIRMTLFHAKRRTNTRPFTLMLDEAHRFLSSDIPTLLAEVRKYGVSIFASCQWLEQLKKTDETILAALLNGTGTKIVMRLRDAEESEKLARSIVPLDLERPVETLIKPTVVGHERVRFANEGSSTSESVTDSQSETEGESWGESETEGYSRSITHTNGTSKGKNKSRNKMHSASEQDSESSASGSMNVASTGSMSGSGETDGQVVWTSTGVFGTEERPSSRESRGQSSHSAKSSNSAKGTNSSRSRGKARSRSSGEGESEGTSEATSESVALTEGESYALSRLYSQSRSQTRGTAQTRGTGFSQGWSEGLQPILKDLPTAVHSIQNELYRAGLLLRSLPIATAYINYVGPQGNVATVFTVPPVFTQKLLPPKQSGVTVEEAFATIAQRIAPRELEPPPAKSPYKLSPRPKRDAGEKLW